MGVLRGGHGASPAPLSMRTPKMRPTQPGHGGCSHPTAKPPVPGPHARRWGFVPARALAPARGPGREAGAGLRWYMAFCRRHPQENQRAALNEALCSCFFLFFFFSLSTPLPASTFCSLPPPLPAAAKPQNNFRAARDPPHPQLWAGCYKTPERFGRPQACPTDAQSRNGALHKFPNLCLEQRELCNKPSGSLAALHKVFTEREEGRTDNMFLRLSYCTR